ncbi:hypothetical protein GJA_3541 [Janthinobacterium agaricidamnosum NBRC 102515 = DSM 9628]|uniref:Uncharacterized protein n=1 Tax=Janthinobacterium agaricidamnosum NBRC 102515 = DSM 9628 TaxID=1349767 RepID=W0V8E3_9BURK|nr:hypothetical protein GJA_3541 [Janthinobacterium agaricidamnosum NBRC 102515 = DSM 9628]
MNDHSNFVKRLYICNKGNFDKKNCVTTTKHRDVHHTTPVLPD